MDILSMLLIAVGLAMDSFTVSIASGLTFHQIKIHHAFQMALFFGIFQTFMPVAGWWTGLNIKEFIAGFDHWIAFGILTAIGCKMIYDSAQKNTEAPGFNPWNLPILVALSLATSIDAFAVGISFAILDISIALPIILIGIVTFALSFLGVLMGDRLEHIYEKRIGIIGGIILIGIGIKILLDHIA